MSQPDPDFLKFFADGFQRELEAVAIPGMADASWDRKAAWLLWSERRRPAVSPVVGTADVIDPQASVFD